MKRLFIRIGIILVGIVLIFLTPFFLIKPSEDNYLIEYNHKVDLVKSTTQPRIILIGGSNLAFGVDSKQIADALQMNVVNFGLHGGIGIRYPVEDCLKYIKEGDVVVMQFEYALYYNGGCGEPATMPMFLHTNMTMDYSILSLSDWRSIVLGIPQYSYNHSLAVLRGNNKKSRRWFFSYTNKGFNEYGDEISHLEYSYSGFLPPVQRNDGKISKSFICWLSKIIAEYKKKGARIIMVPPVCVESTFRNEYTDDIGKALQRINYPFVVAPNSMVLNDNCAFDTGYHMNKEGVRQNTINLITILKEELHKKGA